MKTVKTIQFDIDGVLADFIWGYTSLASKKFGIQPFTTHAQPQWNFTCTTRKQDTELWEEIKSSPDFWANLPPLVSDAEMQALGSLCKTQNVYFATSRPGNRTREQSIDWLESFGIDRPQVIVTSYKGEIAKACGAHFAIDDKAGNAVAISYMAPKTVSFLIDRPYNQLNPEVIGGSVLRVKTVTDFLKYVKERV